MKDEIIEGLKKLNGEEWTNFDDACCEYTKYVTLYDELTETSIELIATCESVEIATIIAEMPRWLQWQNDRIEQLEQVLIQINAILNILNSDTNTMVAINMIASLANKALGNEGGTP